MITSILKGISKKYGVPISTLKLNAKILKELNLISYGTASNQRKAKLSDFGGVVLNLVEEDHILEKIHPNERALRFTLRKPKNRIKPTRRPSRISEGEYIMLKKR